MVNDDPSKAIVFALSAGFLWGVSPWLLKKGLASSDVSSATLVSQYVSTATLIAIAAVTGDLWSGRLNWSVFLIFAAAGIAASFGKIFLNKGIDSVGAARSVSVKNSAPIITVLLGATILGERIDIATVAGALFIVGGILLLSMVDRKVDAPNRLVYFMYPLLSALCFGINPTLKKVGTAGSRLPAVGAVINHITSLGFMLTGGRLLEIRPSRDRVPRGSLALFGISGLLEGLASLCTYYALQYGPSVLVAPIWRISPLITFVLAHFTLKGLETVTWRDGSAAVCIVVGVWVLSAG